MSVDLKNAFRLSFVTGETELPIPAVSQILVRLRSGPVWDVASIAPPKKLARTRREREAWDPTLLQQLAWSRRPVSDAMRRDGIA